MNAKSWTIGLLAALSLLPAFRAEARESGPFTMALKYAPQESVGSTNAVLAPGISDRPVRLSIVDGRAGADPTVIGEISDHADKVFPIHVSNDPIAWANDTLQKDAAEWGIKASPGASLVLTGKLTQFRLVASTKAFGSTYNAQFQVAFTLADARGRTLWQGTVEGSANRYGKERSADNANEVLSDALKEAYSNAFNDADLQSAWLGKGKPVATVATAAAPAAAAEPARSPSEMLADLVKLKKQGFTTDLLVDYVNQKTLTKSLSADDLVKWKNAGMPQEVIKAAMARAK
ncbi:MAG TPA: hypothetical protein VGH73_17105 [Thermoanaerobaculia bacterium]|jgi:hypothetical protein